MKNPRLHTLASRITWSLACCVVILGTIMQTASAAPLSKAQKTVLKEGIYFFNTDLDTCGNTVGGATTVGPPGAANTDEIKIFAAEPVTSTWNISDAKVEQWFLKQGGARSSKAKYHLDSSNIGAITAVVKAAKVSPVFFYLYTVNEGGGAGGFINHYGSDVAGGGPANAKRDAEYLASQSKIMNSNPSWIDAGNPVDFVPQDVKTAGNANFQSTPSGTIGRVYIPATAAVTWEVYYPNGLKKEYNKVQNYGTPLSDAMRNIKVMGGDPLQGGATISSGATSCETTGGVTGEGMTKGINFALAIAKNDGYGYDQSKRTTGYPKWQADQNCKTACGSFDCSSFIAAILTEAGYFKSNPNFATGSEGDALIGAGFTKVASSATTSAGLKPGDILLKNGHTEMYIGNNQNVGAHINENGGITGGQTGDQTAHEISVGPYWNDGWTGVYRAPN